MQTKDSTIFFNELIEQHKGILYKVAKTYCKDATDREDLLQEIMIQLWKSVHKYNNEFKTSTWVYRISLNVAISFYRKNGAKTSQTTDLNEQNLQIPADEVGEREFRLNLLEQFINELNSFDKAIILLHLEDRNHADIADILGISVSNVSTKLGRIKDKLKQRFSTYKF
ncbi:MAG TPA: RNA polymerase subunit sigma-70 [Bacteroidales bacterium]|nr:RNA polymerase subunit sigma-70 [Bacteroidales bacterium]